MRILIATDAYRPQVNGVVRTYERLAENVAALGAELTFLTPSHFRSIPVSDLSADPAGIAQLPRARPNSFARQRRIAIHIATEGPVGWMTRHYCLRAGIPFTTSFHTRFAEYVSSRWLMPESWVYGLQRRFHQCRRRHDGGDAEPRPGPVATWLPASSCRGRAASIPNLFRPRLRAPLRRRAGVHLCRPHRHREEHRGVSFRSICPAARSWSATDLLLATLERKYPEVMFTGVVEGEELACCYASADVFVFPSRTDTFGMVHPRGDGVGRPGGGLPRLRGRGISWRRACPVCSMRTCLRRAQALTLDRGQVRAAAQAFQLGGGGAHVPRQRP